MAFLFEMSEQVKEVQDYIIQNNDLYGGRKYIIQNMDRYYNGLELDTDEKKLARWERTPFYIYYPKIISSFTSSIFKKPPLSILPIENIYNIDLLKNTLNEYVTQIPLEVLKQGFCATIVDYSNELKTPYLTFIKSESFVSFRVSNDKGYPELSQFIYSVFEEEQDETNEFKVKIVKKHYVWDLVEGQARVRKYTRIQTEPDKSKRVREGDKSEREDILESEELILMNGKPLKYLPIIIHGKETNNYTIDKSVLQDVSDLNINIFQRAVDQVEVLHLTAMPTPYITGADSDDPNLPTTIGSSKIWVVENPDSKIGLMEFSGKSYEAHASFIEDLKEAMAVQGAQILKKQGVSRETATSVLIRTNKETAIITDIVQNISSQVEEFLKIYFEWMGEKTKDIQYKLNSDFVNTEMEPNAQIALIRSWLDGAISHKTVFNKLKEGEIVEANKTFEQELKEIDKNPPPFFGKEAEAKLKGSNMEIPNGTKNTEITN